MSSSRPLAPPAVPECPPPVGAARPRPPVRRRGDVGPGGPRLRGFLLGSMAVLRRNQSERIKKALDQGRHGAPAVQARLGPARPRPLEGGGHGARPPDRAGDRRRPDRHPPLRQPADRRDDRRDHALRAWPSRSTSTPPEVCYPAAGYAQVAGPDSREIKAGALSAPFRSLVYSKGEGGPGELQEVYYSWWYNGRWNATTGVQKRFERIASMYKVQLARRVNPGEKRDVGNPCESLLHELLPDLDRRMSAKTLPPS